MARNRVGVSFSPTTQIFVRRVDHQHVTNEPTQPKLTIIGDRFPTVGKRFELLCKFNTTAEDAIPVDWFKDGEMVAPTARYSFSNSLRSAEGVQTSTLIIKEPRLVDAGTYVCRTPLDTLNSVKVYIVTDSSTDLTIDGSARFEGEDMKITCNMTGEPERNWNIVWFKDGEQVDISLPRIAVSRFEDLFEKKMSSTLQIRKSRISDSGNYTCRTNKNHMKTVHIQVREAESSQRDLMLPQDKKVFEGGSVIFFCEAPDTATSITWKHSSGRMPVNSSVYDWFGTKSALKVPAVSMADAGVVTCIVDEPGWRRVVSADLHVYEASYWREQLRGKGYPVIELESERDVVQRGTSVQLKCSSYGQPKPSILWLKDHFPVDTTNKRFSLLSSGTLEIRNVTQRDEGVYECEAENEVGVAYSAPAVLETVDTSSLSPGVTITGNFRPEYGSNATITCEAIGDVRPPAGIEWFKDGFRIRGNSEKYSETIDRKIKYLKSILTIVNIQVTDNGVYVCRSTDMHIAATRLIAHEALLTEKDRERPPAIPQNLTVRSVSETQLVLTWDLPLRSLINKEIIMYQIKYHQLDDPISDEVLNVTTNKTHVDISDLEMNTDYQLKIRAYTSKGPGPWSNWLSFHTFGQIPPAPKNVKLRNTSRTSIEVTWDAPSVQVAGYKIYYNMLASPEMEDSSTLEIGPYTVAEITGLDPLTTYGVRVQAKSFDGYYGTLSEMVNIDLNQEYGTDEETKSVIPPAPKNVKLRNTSRTSIEVTWDAPSVQVAGYKIYYNMLASPEMEDSSTLEIGPYTVAEITGLDPHTTYGVRVQAKSVDGYYGTLSEMVNIDLNQEYGTDEETKSVIPPAPKNVKLRNTSRTSIEVTWDAPSVQVAGYKIYYNMLASPEMEDSSTLEIGPYTVAEITGLDPHTTYGVRVQAKSVDGYYGTLSEMVNIDLNKEYTSSLAPGVTITGNWTPEYGSNATITCEAIGAEHVPDDIDWFHHGNRIRADSEKYSVTKLIRRKIKSLKSILTIGNIQVSDSGVYVCRSTDDYITSMRLTVLKELKAPIGINITETAENGSLSLQLKWVDPNTRVSDLLEGVHRLYTVLMWDGREQETTRVDQPELLMSGFDWNVTYNFSVRVEEGNYFSAWTNISFLSTSKNVGPVGPVLEVRVRAVSKSMVVVWWKEPEVVIEPIQGYRVFYTDHPEMPLHMWTVQEVIKSNLAVLSSLEPDTVYTFGVQAYTENGQGPLSDLVQAPSDGEKQKVESRLPSIPTDLQLKVYRGIKPSMMVTWNSTDSAIQTYNIKWGAYMLPSTTASLPWNKTRYLITGLEYNTTYTVSVSASNSVGKGDAVTESITTLPEVEAKTVNESDSTNGSIEAPQGAPENLRVRPVSPTAMLVSWSYLDNEYVIIQGYRILFTSRPEHPFFMWNVKDVGLDNTIVVDGLTPRTTYYFTVQAYTLLEEGPFSNPVQVLGSPQVIFEPEIQHVQEGGVASFFCKSSDGYTLKFEWMRNSKVVSVRSPIYEIVTKHWFSVLRVLRADPDRDSGAFTCVASNKNGTTNATGTLKVYEVSDVPAGYPQITVQPRVKAVVRGGTVTLSCEATGDPEPTIKWLKDSFPVHVENTRITSLQSGVLVVTEARESDVGQYECVAENQVGVAYSKGANLYVRAQRVPPRFTIVPSNMLVKHGADVNLTCAAFGTPMPFVKWLEGKRQLTDESSVPMGQNVLQLKNVRLSRNYTCIATTNQHKIEMTIEVVVGETPTITEGPKDRLTVDGEPLSFFCHGTGYPLPSFNWMKNFRVIIPRWSKYEIITRFNVSTLRIKEVTSADSGLYSCRVSNKHGTARARASLEVHQEIPSGYPQLVRQPSSRAVDTDKPALMQCKATGDPQPSIHWLKDFFPVNINDSNIKLLDSGSLEILYTRTSDDGKYECVAENIKGSAYSQAATLLVRVRRVPPRFTVHPVDSVVTPGSNVNLSCAAEGSPMPSVKWLQGTEELTDEASGPIGRNDLLLKDVRETKLYTCIATSSLGQEETIARVTVAEQPEITQPPKDQLSVNNETVSFICRASGLPAPRFEWKRGSDVLHQYALHHEIINEGDTSVLRVHRVRSSSDNGTYTCIAHNQYGEARVSASLTVHDVKPNGYPRIVLNPSLKAVELGRVALMQCEARGNPRPTIRWLKDYFPVNMSDPRIKLWHSGYLEIRSSRDSDAGKYECVAENIKGSAYSLDAALHVRVRRVPPKITIVPTDMFVKPGSDVNLTCVAVGSPTPFVMWHEGSRQLTDESNVPIGRNQLLLKNVSESKTYTCVASSVLGREETEACVVVEEPVPPGFPPREVQARAASSSTIVVGWEEPEYLVDSSFQGYRVYYTRRPGEALKNWNMKDVDRDSTVTSISGLNSKALYTITVTARSRYGEGPTSLPVQVVTVTGYSSHSQLPYQPLNLHADLISANEIEVMWEAPKEAETIKSYELYYNDSHFRQNIRISIKPPIERYKLTDLTPDTVYHIQVSAKSERGEGPKTPTIQAKTKMFVPGKPRKVRTEAINSTAIFVEWRPPTESDRNGIIRGYQVYFYEVNSNDELINGTQTRFYDTFDGTKHEAVITGLEPDTRYNVRVAAYTRKGDGIRSKPRVITTKGAVPSPPRNLHVDLLQEDPPRIKVTWQRPRETHGTLENYKIIWGRIGERYEEKILPSEKYSFLTYSLDKGKTYEFRVSAKNDVDYSEQAVENLKTPDRGPAGAPQNFTATGISETSVRLTWDLPALPLRNRHIAMYQITYHKLSDTINEEDLNVTDTYVDISGLEMKTYYRFKIKAYTSKGSGPWSNNLHFRTFGHMPPAPKNVKIRRTSSSIIEVTWDEPDFPVAGYKIYYNQFATPEMDVWQSLETGPYTVAEITGLESHTVYAVRVQAKSVDDRYGNFSEMVTTDFIPKFRKDVVQNFRVTLRTSNMVRLSWDPPQKPGVNSYQLKYEGVKNYWENGVIKQIYQAKEEVRIAGQMTTWTLLNLQPKMKFEFNISAIFQDSTAGEDQHIIVETLIEVRKDVVQNFRVTLRTSNMVRLSWDPPQKPGVNSYQLKYEGVKNYWENGVIKQIYQAKEEVRIAGQMTTWTLLNLQPKMKFEFNISAIFQDSTAGEDQHIIVETLIEVPPAPKNVKIRRTSSSIIEVTWDEPDFPVAGYKIYYNQFVMPELDVWQSLETGPYTVAEITGLESHTVYAVRVQAKSVDDRYGNFSEIVTTDFIPKSPGSPPRNVRARAASSTTIIVSWNEPEIPNGIIQGYKVFYTLQPEKPIFFWDVHDVTNDNELTTISGLDPNQSYTISALAYSRIGQGPMSHPIQVLTSQGAGHQVPYQPLNLHADLISANEIEVMWEAPKEAETIKSYELHYNDSHFRQNIRISIKPPIERYKLTDLTPDTVYHIQVSAKSERGEGPKTPTIQAKTKMFVPGEPRKVRTEAINSTAIFVEWRPPTESDRNGIIRGYQVYFYEVDSNDELIIGTQPRFYDTFDGTKHEAVITGLEPDTRYNVRVAAYTRKGDGIRSKPRVITTKGAVPSPPRRLHVDLLQEDPPRIKVTWQRPRETHGTLENYKIIWGRIGERYEEKILHSEKYSFLTYSLDKGKTYEFRVSAKNDVDYGEHAVENLKIPDGVPGAPTITYVEEYSTEIYLRWKPPMTGNEAIMGYKVWYQITNRKYSYSYYVFTVKKPEAVIGGLEPDTRYNVQVAAQTHKGNGNKTRDWTYKTKPAAVPDAPQNLAATMLGTGGVRVHWDPPSSIPNQDVLHYKLVFYPQGEEGNASSLQTNTTIIDVGPFPYDFIYLFKVRVYTANGAGPYAKMIFKTF